jgi:hypothetical protein
MERKLSSGINSNGSRRWQEGARHEHSAGRSFVLDFLSNPRQRRRVAEKVAWASDDMQQKREMLGHHALLVSKEGPCGVASREEVAEITGHHFDLLRYDHGSVRSSG